MLKEKTKTIPWREYCKSIAQKVIIFLIMIYLLIMTVIYSDDTIISDNSVEITDHALIIIISSSILFLLVLFTFSWFLFAQDRESFGIEKFYSRKGLILAFMSAIFITLLYLLLDITINDGYLELGPVLAFAAVEKYLSSTFGIDLSFIATDLSVGIYYQELRNYIFIAAYILLLLFPLLTLLIILTREGRSTLFGKKESSEEDSSIIRSFFVVIFGFPIISFLSTIISNIEENNAFLSILTVAVTIFTIWHLLKLLWKGTKLLAFFTYSNLLIIFPIITLFWLFPVASWSIWDIVEYFRDNPGASFSIDTVIFDWLNNLTINAFAMERIIEFDFMIIIGIAAAVIGFAEGVSLGAIIGFFRRGSGIVTTGKVVSETAPQTISIIKIFITIGTWLVLLWDKIAWIFQMFVLEFHLDFSFELPRIVIYLNDLIEWLKPLLPTFIPLAILVIPLYIVFTSALKFFSVRLATSRIEEDQQLFILLISSAFVLIVTTILADVQELSKVTGTPEASAVPLMTGIFYDAGILTWTIKIIMYIEAFAFYAGFLFLIYQVLRKTRKDKVGSKPITTQTKTDFDDYFDKTPTDLPKIEESTENPLKSSDEDFEL